MVIAIDGVASSGKSSLARGLAKRLGYRYCGTGSIYRAVALKINSNSLTEKDADKISKLLKNTKVDIWFSEGESKIFLDGQDVTSKINTPEISLFTPKIATLSQVRGFVRKIQHKLGDSGNIIVEGRDIATVVFPNADIKIFMTASDEVRTKRRLLDFEKQGKLFSYEEALRDILSRDKADTERKVSPLIVAKDSIVFDNSDYTIEQSLDILEKMIKNFKTR